MMYIHQEGDLISEGWGRRKEGRKAGSVKGKGNWKVIVIRILVTQVVPIRANTDKHMHTVMTRNVVSTPHTLRSLAMIEHTRL